MERLCPPRRKYVSYPWLTGSIVTPFFYKGEHGATVCEVLSLHGSHMATWGVKT